MKLPLSLIKSLITIDLSVQKISETLTLLGIEVDRVLNEHPSFAQVIAVQVLDTKRHPNADKLQVAEVSDGTQLHTVVCAAPNCRVGIKTAFAKAGAILTDRDGLQRQIEKGVVRGVASDGMLCSASELRISDENEGILELPEEIELGQDLAALLWDPVFELSLTPNLGHCMSALGIARELSAYLQLPLHQQKTHLSEKGESSVHIHVTEGTLCPRYLGRQIDGIQVAPSPFWLRRQLELCGLQSINNIVDTTNYIMMKLGQPLHAFDFDSIEGEKIEVAAAKQPQKFLGLDGAEYPITPGMLLISDQKKPIAIAGVMGGANSAISDSTTSIFLEAAYFDLMTVRSSSKKLGLRTESSHRFEKGTDPDGIEEALNAATQLILQLCKGATAKKAIECKKGTLIPREIRCRIERTNQILGTKLSFTEIEEIFQRLFFRTTSTDKGSLSVTVPLYRADLVEEIDLIEEVARIYGYNNIEKRLPLCTTSQIPNDPTFVFENQMRHRLVGLGLQEFLTCDLISPKLSAIAQEIASPDVALLQTLHSKSEDYSILRTSLLPGLLQVTKGNFDQKNLSIAAFEIGRIHFLQKGEQNTLVELPVAALLLTGQSTPSHWSRKRPEFDFFDLKGFIESLLDSFKIEGCRFPPSEHISFHPGRQADIQIHEEKIGSFGEVHPALLEKFDIKQRVLYAEINLDQMRKLHPAARVMSPLSAFPSSDRDCTLVLDQKLPIDSVLKAIHSISSPLLERVELIDLYIPDGAAQKNATFRFTYRDPLKTISFEEVEVEHTKILLHIKQLQN